MSSPVYRQPLGQIHRHPFIYNGWHRLRRGRSVGTRAPVTVAVRPPQRIGGGGAPWAPAPKPEARSPIDPKGSPPPPSPPSETLPGRIPICHAAKEERGSGGLPLAGGAWQNRIPKDSRGGRDGFLGILCSGYLLVPGRRWWTHVVQAAITSCLHRQLLLVTTDHWLPGTKTHPWPCVAYWSCGHTRNGGARCLA